MHCFISMYVGICITVKPHYGDMVLKRMRHLYMKVFALYILAVWFFLRSKNKHFYKHYFLKCLVRLIRPCSIFVCQVGCSAFLACAYTFLLSSTYSCDGRLSSYLDLFLMIELEYSIWANLALLCFSLLANILISKIIYNYWGY